MEFNNGTWFGGKPANTITPAQAATLERLLKEVPSVKRAKLLTFGECETVAAFPAAKYAEARSIFDKHKAQAGEQGGKQ